MNEVISVGCVRKHRHRSNRLTIIRMQTRASRSEVLNNSYNFGLEGKKVFIRPDTTSEQIEADNKLHEELRL